MVIRCPTKGDNIDDIYNESLKWRENTSDGELVACCSINEQLTSRSLIVHVAACRAPIHAADARLTRLPQGHTELPKRVEMVQLITRPCLVVETGAQVRDGVGGTVEGDEEVENKEPEKYK